MSGQLSRNNSLVEFYYKGEQKNAIVDRGITGAR